MKAPPLKYAQAGDIQTEFAVMSSMPIADELHRSARSRR